MVEMTEKIHKKIVQTSLLMLVDMNIIDPGSLTICSPGFTFYQTPKNQPIYINKDNSS